MGKKIITFEPWIGEFGWEVMTWQAKCRRVSRDYDHAIVTSFKGMDPLYTDFAEFMHHSREVRCLDFPNKQYRVDGEWKVFGNPLKEYDILIHARGVAKKASINYRRWKDVLLLLKSSGIKVAVVGTSGDQDVEGTCDERRISLQRLMDLMAGSRVVVGGSSGVMHLAQLCKTPIVTWGDNRTYFGETLERRYKRTWNPFGSEVEYIYVSDFQPSPEEVVSKVREFV